MSKLHPLPDSLRDQRFRFDKRRHLYFWDNMRLTGVTSWKKRYKKKFDSDYWAQRKAQERGVTVEEILAEWDRAREDSGRLGTLVHEAIEADLLGDTLPPMEEEVERRFLMYRRLRTGRLASLTPVAMELQAYSLRWSMAGTMDLLGHIPGKGYLIGDWKTNKQFLSGDAGYDYLLPPFDMLKDNHLNEYAIQVALYRIMLEEHGLKVHSSFIVHLPPKEVGDEPVVHFAPDLRKYVIQALEAA